MSYWINNKLSTTYKIITGSQKLKNFKSSYKQFYAFLVVIHVQYMKSKH